MSNSYPAGQQGYPGNQNQPGQQHTQPPPPSPGPQQQQEPVQTQHPTQAQQPTQTQQPTQAQQSPQYYTQQVGQQPHESQLSGGRKKKERGTSRRPGWGIVAGALILGAVAGGGAGAGVVAFNHSDSGQNPAANSPAAQQAYQEQFGGDPKSATPVSLAAATAMPSVVTISASDGKQSGTGSGVFISEDGYVLTNQHVATLSGASDKATIEVQTSDGTTYPARLVGQDPLYDLAVVKIDNPGDTKFTPIKFADMNDVNVGSEAVAIGAPLGLPNTVSTGIISNRERSISIASSAVKSTPEDAPNNKDLPEFRIPGQEQRQQPSGRISINVLQTDASINHGNSGGALVNDKGELIGVNVAIYSPSAQSGSIGLGFAVPGDIAQRVSQELMSNGKATHGQLGLMARAQPSNAGRSTIFTEGAVVSEVVPDSPAAKAGIQKDDVITKVNDKRMNDAVDLTATIRSYPEGATVKVTVKRNGEEHTMDVTLGGADA